MPAFSPRTRRLPRLDPDHLSRIRVNKKGRRLRRSFLLNEPFLSLFRNEKRFRSFAGPRGRSSFRRRTVFPASLPFSIPQSIIPGGGSFRNPLLSRCRESLFFWGGENRFREIPAKERSPEERPAEEEGTAGSGNAGASWRKGDSRRNSDSARCVCGIALLE